MTRNKRNRDNSEIRDVISKIKNLEKLSDLSSKDLADVGGYADIIAEGSRNIKTSQLRKFFGSVRKMQLKDNWADIEPEFYLLKPKLAVSKGRRLIPDDFYNFMMASMSKVDVGSEEEKFNNFQKFVDLLESVVAYHKFHYPNVK